jgi:hypothetical protein
MHAYNWGPLRDVFAFVAGKGCSIEHQEGVKLAPGARLDLVNTGFLKTIAEL